MPPTPSASSYMDTALFHRLWSALPTSRCDRSFWSAMESFSESFLDERCPLRSQEYFTVPHTGRILQDELHLIDKRTVAEGNEQRMLYEAFVLWNPFAISALVKIPIGIVTEQLLLAVEYKWMSVHFVLSCRSCAFDLQHFTNVSDIPFKGTYYTSNAFRCPMCTDRTEVNALDSVFVFFQLQRLHPVFHSRHYRGFVTEQAQKQRLESFFCPSGAGFATTLRLPRGKYLLSAPFNAALVEIDVEVNASAFGDKDPFLPRIIDVKGYSLEPPARAVPAAKGRGTIGRRESGAADPRKSALVGRRTVLGGRTSRSVPMQSGPLALNPGSASGAPRWSSPTRAASRATEGEAVDKGAADDALDTNTFGAKDVEEEPLPLQSVALKHGKVQLRIYNTTAFSGFVDLYVAFDRRAEFSAAVYPKQFTLPDLLHCMPRGLRSQHLPLCIPLPPSQIPTRGVYVRHYFDLHADDFVDPETIAVLREVHQYSLEDQHGLLVSVDNGGTCFECSFLSVTAAVASSICFFQRTLMRLGEGIALSLRVSVTHGPFYMASFQGQYNDADNMRSAYPDVQLIGPAVYASHHPPVVAPTLHSCLYEAPTVPMAAVQSTVSYEAKTGTAKESEFRAALREEEYALNAFRGANTGDGAFSSFMPWQAAEEATERKASAALGGPHATGRDVPRRSLTSFTTAEKETRMKGYTPNDASKATLVRFELRSVRTTRDMRGEVVAADLYRGSVPLDQHYATEGKDGSDWLGVDYNAPAGSVNEDDFVLPYFLNYLVEQLEGTQLLHEPHALVLAIPLAVMNASLQLSTTLDRSSYIKEYLGPF